MQKTFILSSIAHEHYGALRNIDPDSVSFTYNMNSANEYSFDLYYELNGEIEPLWDKVVPLKYIFIPADDNLVDYGDGKGSLQRGEYFSIDVQEDESSMYKKTITCTSACEVELSQIMLYDIEINNENDTNWLYMLNDEPSSSDENLPVTYFYNDDYDPDPTNYKQHTSLLNRILDKAPQYTLGHIDSSLVNMQRSFSIDGKSIYDALTGDISEAFDCIFLFDSVNKVINVYDLMCTCNSPDSSKSSGICGYRADYYEFYDPETDTCTCPKCGATGSIIDLRLYGTETSTFIDVDNLTDSIQFTTDTDSIKNCFKLKAGDDTMTAAVVGQNPNGSEYIYYWDQSFYDDMPDDLVTTIESYDELYDYYQDDWTYTNSNISNYNYLITKNNNFYNDLYYELTGNKFESISNPIVGYGDLTAAGYACIDLESFLYTTMMKQANKINFNNATEEAQKLVEKMTEATFVLGVHYALGVTSEGSVETSLKNLAKVYANSGFVNMIPTTISYNQSTGKWTGYITVTNLSKDTDVVYAANGVKTSKQEAENNPLNITVSQDFETYTRQYIMKKLESDNDEDKTYDMVSFEIGKITREAEPEFIIDESKLSTYKSDLKYYGYTRLKQFYDECDDVRTTLQTLDTDTSSDGDETVINTNAAVIAAFDKSYSIKQGYINSEMEIRAAEIIILDSSLIYTSQKDTEKTGLYIDISRKMKEIQTALDLKSFFKSHPTSEHTGDQLYNIFCSYRREDTYSNDNYISDGLTNGKLIARAQEFITAAKKEMVKAGTPQHSISTSLYNIFNLDVFKDIRTNFKLGNWLRARVGNTVYRLRLISYGGQASDESNMSVEFSDVTIAPGTMSDIQSILSQASSMATSYSAITQQASDGAATAAALNNVVQSGLDSAKVTLFSGSEKTMELTSHGLLGREWDYETDDYCDEQMLLTNNILCFTEDKWDTVSLGLGKHKFTYFDDGKIVGSASPTNTFKTSVAYGLSSKFVTSGIVYGGQIISGDIYSYNYSPTSNTGTHFDLSTGDFSIAGGRMIYTTSDNTLRLNNVTMDWNTSNKPTLSQLVDVSKAISDANSRIDTADAEITKRAYDSEFQKLVKAVNYTIVGSNYIISPYIGGGYLYLSNDTGSITLDPASKSSEVGKGYLIDCRYNGSEILTVTGNGVLTLNNGILNFGSSEIHQEAMYNASNGEVWYVLKVEDVLDLGHTSVRFGAYKNVGTAKEQDWEEIQVTGTTKKGDKVAAMVGMTVLDYAREIGQDGDDTYIDRSKSKEGTTIKRYQRLTVAADPAAQYTYWGPTAYTYFRGRNIQIGSGNDTYAGYCWIQNAKTEVMNQYPITTTDLWLTDDDVHYGKISKIVARYNQKTEASIIFQYYGKDADGDEDWHLLKLTKENSSDIRLKRDISDCKVNALDDIDKMKVRQFYWKGDGTFEPIGIIADELQEDISERLATGGDLLDTGEIDYKSINMVPYATYAIKGIQELHEIVRQQEARIQELESIIKNKE